MLMQHLDTARASDDEVSYAPDTLAVTDCVISMCSQPLLALRMSQKPEVLASCASRYICYVAWCFIRKWLVFMFDQVLIAQSCSLVLRMTGTCECQSLPCRPLHEVAAWHYCTSS